MLRGQTMLKFIGEEERVRDDINLFVIKVEEYAVEEFAVEEFAVDHSMQKKQTANNQIANT